MSMLLVVAILAVVLLPAGLGFAAACVRFPGARVALLLAGALAPLLCYALLYAWERLTYHDGLFDTSMNDGDLMIVFGLYLAVATVPVAGCIALLGSWLAGRSRSA